MKKNRNKKLADSILYRSYRKGYQYYFNFQISATNNILDLETNLSGIKIIQLIDVYGKIVLEFTSSKKRMSQELTVKSRLYIL